jgi:hypothetical protein
MIEVKIEPETNETKKPDYPYVGKHIGKSGDTYVYFTRSGSGVCLSAPDYDENIDNYTWFEANFTPYYGKITIQTVKP